MQYQSMGQLIADQRKKNNMTQRDLAQKLGVTDKAVSKWERDLSCPDITTISLLADTLGISVSELLELMTMDVGQEEETMDNKTKSDLREALEVAPKAIALAMGVAVLVLSVMGKVESSSAITMLSIGLSSAGVALLGKK